jgi:hypothetical protein
MRSRTLALCVLLGLTVFASSASADHGPERVRVEDVSVEDPVEPLSAPAQVGLNATVPCGANETGTAWARAEVVEAPGAVEVQAQGVEASIETRCSAETHTLALTVPVEVGFTQNATAFEPLSASIAVHVQKNGTDGNATEMEPARATVTATPGYFSLFNVRADTKIAEAEPDERIRFPIVIDNFSNAPTRFEFTLAEDVPSGFQTVVPPPVVVDGRPGEGNATARVYLDVFTPFRNGWVNEVGSIPLRVDSYYAPDQNIEGETAQVSVRAKAKGLHVPGPGLGLAGLALLATAAAVHRRA